MEFAEALRILTLIYFVIGCGTAIPFLLFGVDKVESSAQNSYVFRPILFPGVVLIWPIVIMRWNFLRNNKDD